MKKVEQVEVEYVKKTTALMIAVICLILGFGIGMIFSNLSNPNRGAVRQSVAQQPTPQANQPSQPQQSAQDVQKLNQIMNLKQMLTSNPKDAQSWAMLGHAYFDLNRYDEAIDAYRKHLEINPDNPNVWTDMGIMYRRKKMPQDAIKCFNEAIKKDPGHEQSRFNKGIVLMFDLMNKEEAVKSWQDLLKVNPNAKAPDGRPVSEIINIYSKPNLK
jgi:cytochrome c-type biogenesis protein CcmH/NrfG